jgi:aminomethyltransferase
VSAEPLRRTPLFERHVAAGGRMVPFAGFELPVMYRGILEEHRAVRTSAGLFDVSHMGQLRLRGGGALAFAQRVFTNDALGMRDGQVRYGLLCREDGGVIDDVTLYRRTADDLFFCVNAVNTGPVLAWLREAGAAAAGCDLVDESEATALLAVQGPRARPLVHRLCTGPEPRMARFRFAERELAGVPCGLSRTGYTGEDGYEIYAPAARATAVWDALVAAGGAELTLAGLGARDTLRTEMAYPLYGHELDLEHDPIEAGLERFVAFGRGFIGEAALARRRERGPERRLVGLLLEGRQAARPGATIADDGPVGVVTSGTYAPSVERAIAIGYVPARHGAPGTRLSVEVRGRPLPCEVCPTPFLHRKAG